MTAEQMIRMVHLIDFACARPLSYRLTKCPTPNSFGTQATIERNVNFKGRSNKTFRCWIST